MTNSPFCLMIASMFAAQHLTAQTLTSAYHFSDPEQLMSYPFSFGSTFTDPWAATFTVNGVQHHLIGTTSALADGTGTVVTPTGVYKDVLRIHIVSEYSDSINIAGSVSVIRHLKDKYFWQKPDEHVPFLAITTETATGSSPTQTLTFRNDVINSVTVPSSVRKFSIFPNPGRGVFNIDCDVYAEDALLHLTDVLGRSIHKKPADTKNIQLDLSGYKAGPYILSMTVGGRLIWAEKLLVCD